MALWIKMNHQPLRRRTIPATTTIDESGSYEFSNLPPLNYIVREVPQPGWHRTSPVAMQSTIQYNLSTGITSPTFQHHPEFDHFCQRYRTVCSIHNDDSTGVARYQCVAGCICTRSPTELVRTDFRWLNGLAPTAHSLEPSISDDGRYVAFRSFGTTLSATPVNANIVNVYVRDRVAGTTQLISHGVSSPANDYSYEPILSGDGRTLMFWSWASNLVSDDFDLLPDLFIKDLVGGGLVRVEASQVVPAMPISETWVGTFW